MPPQYIADPPRKRPLRNMNDESTKKGFGLMKIDTLQDAKDFLTACKSALMQHTKNTTHRALINSMGLHDVSLPVCEMMSLFGNKSIGSCVLKTSSSLYPRMKIILKSLPPPVYLVFTMLSVCVCTFTSWAAPVYPLCMQRQLHHVHILYRLPCSLLWPLASVL